MLGDRLLGRNRDDFQMKVFQQVLEQDVRIRAVVEDQAVAVADLSLEKIPLAEHGFVAGQDRELADQVPGHAATNLQPGPGKEADSDVGLVRRGEANGAMGAEAGGDELVARARVTRRMVLDAEIAH